MKAIRFNVTIPRYVIGKAAGQLYPPLLWSGISCMSYKDIPEPELPGPDWVKLNTRLAGICGTDMSTITLHTSTYYEPFSSSPFTLGHEMVGTIAVTRPRSGRLAGRRARDRRADPVVRPARLRRGRLVRVLPERRTQPLHQRRPWESRPRNVDRLVRRYRRQLEPDPHRPSIAALPRPGADQRRERPAGRTVCLRPARRPTEHARR